MESEDGMDEEPKALGEPGGLEETRKKPAWGKTVKVSLGVLGGLSLLMGYISAAGMQESEREIGARRPIDDFFASFNARNLEALRATLHYPHIQISAHGTRIYYDPEDFSIDFQSLLEEGWVLTTLDSCALRQSCDEMVHFEVQFSMHRSHREEARRYATYQSLLIVTLREGRWGIQCRSSFPPQNA